MLTKKESYEAARLDHKAWQRRLHEAVDNGSSEQELTKLRFEEERASEERRQAFEIYMNEE